MKNIIITILLLVAATSVVAQDTIKYGDPQYLFNRRIHPALRNININPMGLIDFTQLNDTTGAPLLPIIAFNIERYHSNPYFSPYYYTNTPIRIYGIALNMFHIQGTTDVHDSVAILQYSNGKLKLLRVSENCTRTNLFMFEGYYDIRSYTYIGRKTAFSYCHEFFFDSPASVHDTFLVWIKPSPLGAVPIGENIRNIPLYDSIGYPEIYNNELDERYCDMDLFSPISVLNGVIFNLPNLDHIDYWGMAFPIIMPLDGVDTLGEINPDSLWYNIPDSLGVLEIGAEPEVSLAPNPASGSTTLIADVPVSRLLMHNVDGRLVRELKPESPRVEIDLAGLPGGLYIISAVTPRGTAHRKLLVR